MQIVGDNLHEISNPVSLEKYEKVSNLSSVENLLKVLSVNENKNLHFLKNK